MPGGGCKGWTRLFLFVGGNEMRSIGISQTKIVPMEREICLSRLKIRRQ